jgi:DNA-binding PadR family transcriptional regulator
MAELISRTEELILLAVGKLGADAYGITIRRELQRALGKKYSTGAVYIPLERLAKKGFLASRIADPTPQRGGRGKRYYHLTQKGLTALRASKALYETLWAGLPELDASVRGAG